MERQTDRQTDTLTRNRNSSFLTSTTFGAEYRLSLIFRPKLAHAAARYVCDS